MTDPRYIPAGLAAAETVVGNQVDDERDNRAGETVGADDARADEARAGGDVDLAGAHRDGDPTPVGADDADADRRRAAGEDPA